MIKAFDANSDQVVTRSEIYDMFVLNRGKLVKYFEGQLNETLRELTLVTYRPRTVVGVDGVEYYFSSADQIKSYNDSVQFCQDWNGTLSSST